MKINKNINTTIITDNNISLIKELESEIIINNIHKLLKNKF